MRCMLKCKYPPPPDQSWSYLSFIEIQPSIVCRYNAIENILLNKQNDNVKCYS